MKNWKTSVTGGLAIVTAIWNFVSTGTITPEGISSIMAGLGLILAKDSNVTGGTVNQ